MTLRLAFHGLADLIGHGTTVAADWPIKSRVNGLANTNSIVFFISNSAVATDVTDLAVIVDVFLQNLNFLFAPLTLAPLMS